MGINLKKCLKFAATHTSVLSLFITTISPLHVYAKDDEQEISGIQATGMLMKQVGDAFLNKQRQQLNMMQAQRNAPPPIQLLPSKFFPQCRLPKAKSDLPVNACSEVPNPNDQMGVMMMRQFQQTALDNESMFDNLLSVGQNSPQPVGIQCLEDNMKIALSQIQDKLNELEALSTKIKKETQAFKEMNKKLLTDMDSEAGELYGDPNPNIKNRTNRFDKYFSADCKRIIGDKNLSSFKTQGGLLGLRDSVLAPSNQSASDLINDEAKLTKDFDQQLKKIEKQIKEEGAENWSFRPAELVGRGRNPFLGMQQTIQSQKTELDREVKRIRGILRDEVGYDLPPLDNNFSHNLKDFSVNAKSFFRKKAINECVTMSGSGTGLSVEKVLDGLRHSSAGVQGNVVNNYRAGLESILKTDAFIEEKLEAIKKLDQEYGVGRIKVKYSNGVGKEAVDTPYELFRKNVSLCEDRVDQDNTYSANNPGSKSVAEKIKRADTYIKKILSLEKSFAKNMVHEIRNQVMNCNGQAMEKSSCTADNADITNPKSQGFCMSHAVACSNQIKSCFSEANKVVEMKTQKIKTLGANYDRNVAVLVASQERFLGLVKQQTLRDAEFLKRFIPGSEYSFPKDLFVKMPEPEMNPKYGIELRGGGELKAIEELPKKIGLLKEMLKEQGNAVKGQLANYIKDQKSALEANKKDWQTIAKRCSKANDEMKKMAAEAYAKQQEDFGKANAFCTKFDMMRQNPMGGCDEADDLFNDAMEVSGAFLDQRVLSDVSEFKAHCKQAQNEKDRGTDDEDEEDKYSPLADLCRSQGNDTAKVQSEMAEMVMGIIPSDLSEHKAAIESFILNKSTDLPDEVRYTTFGRKVRSLKSSLYSNYKDKAAYEALITSSTASDANKTNGKALLDSLAFKAGAKGLCQNIIADSIVRAVNGCEATASANCVKEKQKELVDQTPDDSDLKSAQRSIASIEDSYKTSESGRIGEQLNAPCMARKASGQRGSSLDAFDLEFLGEDAKEFMSGGFIQ